MKVTTTKKQLKALLEVADQQVKRPDQFVLHAIRINNEGFAALNSFTLAIVPITGEELPKTEILLARKHAEELCKLAGKQTIELTDNGDNIKAALKNAKDIVEREYEYPKCEEEVPPPYHDIVNAAKKDNEYSITLDAQLLVNLAKVLSPGRFKGDYGQNIVTLKFGSILHEPILIEGRIGHGVIVPCEPVTQ